VYIWRPQEALNLHSFKPNSKWEKMKQMAGATAKHYCMLCWRLGTDSPTVLQNIKSNCIFFQILKKCFRIRIPMRKMTKSGLRYLKCAEQGGWHLSTRAKTHPSHARIHQSKQEEEKLRKFAIRYSVHYKEKIIEMSNGWINWRQFAFHEIG